MPLTVRVYVPSVIVLDVVSFRVELPGAVSELGVTVAVTPDGSPVTLSATLLEKPPTDASDPGQQPQPRRDHIVAVRTATM